MAIPAIPGWTDSFDHYTDLRMKWDNLVALYNPALAPGTSEAPALAPGAGTNGSNAVFINAPLFRNQCMMKRNLPAQDTYIFGFYLYVSPTFSVQYTFPTPNVPTDIVAFENNDTPQIVLALTPNATLYLYNTASTTLATATNPISTGSYHFIEILRTLSTGVVTVKVDDGVVLSVTGVNVGSAQTNQCRFGVFDYGNGTCQYSYYIDDLHILDGTGPAPFNTFIGAWRVQASFARAAGSNAAWAANGAASDWQCVSDATPDDDTTYISTVTPNAKATFLMSALPSNITQVRAVNLLQDSRVDDGGSHVVQGVAISPATSGTESDAAAAPSLGASYGYSTTPYPNDPNTSTQWTPTALNAAEFGVKFIS